MSNNTYNADSIQVLEGLEAVRKRPGMYIGTTDKKGLHHMVWEIVDNSIDEALAGHCSEIYVRLTNEQSIIVGDNGRGLPLGTHSKTGKSAIETIFTVLHAGGKFDESNYKVSGGLHGVGASVVNALSEYLKVTVRKGENYYGMEFAKGDVTVPFAEFKEDDIRSYGLPWDGTRIEFKPDAEIFKEGTTFDHDVIKNRLKELAFLNKGIKILFLDENVEVEQDGENSESRYFSEEFIYEGGIKEYINYLTPNKDDLLIKEPFYAEKEVDNIVVELSLQYTKGYNNNILSYVNNISTHEGGTHVEGFRNSLTRIINNYLKSHASKNSKVESLTGDDVREGLVAVVSIKHRDPQFEGQTKAKLSNVDARQAVSQAFSETFERFLNENPNVAKTLVEKGELASKARLAAKRAREATRRKSPLDSLGFASKLADCRSNEVEKCELYIVEGDSAGGSAKQGRDSKFQAILPLRGKVLNVEKARLDKALGNKEIVTMLQAIGCGFGDEFDITKLKYGKIIIMTDADVDGLHIGTLLMTFFYRYLPELIKGGHLYLAKPPLFKVNIGKRVEYCYSDDELEELRKNNNVTGVQRYKGLGEMNAEQLWETTMDPANRVLDKIEALDEESNENNLVFTRLMGAGVDGRKEFITQRAKYAKVDV